MKPMQFAPMRVAVCAKSEAAERYIRTAGINPQAAIPAVPGAVAQSADDLVFRGGKTIANLKFVNFYIGSQAWNPSDITNIDQALSAAMSDRNLNNVMMQYFSGPITSQSLPSHNLPGSAPAVVSQGDAEQLVATLFKQGALAGVDLTSTVVNLMLPPGTILTTDEATTSAKTLQGLKPTAHGAATTITAAIPVEDQASSANGLGGYHGSIHLTMSGPSVTIYYAIGAFSQTLPNGKQNGIVAFTDSWKNVVATFYHELNEARTDPDVEDAIRTGQDSFLGWTSGNGEECGDEPIRNAVSLSDVFKEVRLTDGSGTVPVQFMYSNAVHAPEGPIPQPHQAVSGKSRKKTKGAKAAKAAGAR